MKDTDFIAIFKLPFAEAEQFFRDKLNIPTAKWDDISGAAHAKAFTSAGAYHADLLDDLRKMTDKAIAGGMDIGEFRKQFKPLVERYGWQLKGGGAAWRSDLIWRTNIATSYQAGRWQQFEDGGIEYLMYIHKDGLMHPRLNHVVLDNMIFAISDPFWTANYPPNGFGCHCRAVMATEAEYLRAASDRKKRPAGWENMADTGWNYNVGQAGQEQGYRSLVDKFDSLPNDIARSWFARFAGEPAFARFVDGKIKGDFPVAVLKPVDMDLLGTQSQTVWLSQETLVTHFEKHPEIGPRDYALMQEVIDTGEVYQQNAERIIYLWRGERLYRAAVKTTMSRDRNYLLTLFRTKDRAAYDEVRSKYKRIR